MRQFGPLKTKQFEIASRNNRDTWQVLSMKLFHFEISGFITAQSVVTRLSIAGLLVLAFLLPAAAQERAVRQPIALLETPSNPVADPRAQVVDGHSRFTILTPQLIRMEWAADGKFEDRDPSSLSIVAFRCRILSRRSRQGD